MQELVVFNNEQFGQVRTVEQDGEPYFVLADVCRVLEIQNSADVAKRLEDDERSRFNLGRQGDAIIVNESGLYAVILRSDKPLAKSFRKWITAEVLPSLRKTGTYSLKPISSYESELLSVRDRENRVSGANILLKIAVDIKVESYKQVLYSNITKMLTGEYLLPLPKPEHKTYSATEIGARLRISANKVGIIANLNNLKTPQFGEWFYDKAKHADKQVQTFRYYENAILTIEKFLSEDKP